MHSGPDSLLQLYKEILGRLEFIGFFIYVRRDLRVLVFWFALAKAYLHLTAQKS
jgi:hypothetical protein